MRHGQNGDIFELGANRALDQLVRLGVDAGGGLVQYEDFGFAQEGTR